MSAEGGGDGLWGFGANEHHQLGSLGTAAPDVLRPTCLSLVPPSCVRSHYCGAYHTLFVCEGDEMPTPSSTSDHSGSETSETGCRQQLWGIGYNGDGQLGVRDVSECRTPVPVEGLGSKQVSLVIQGHYHTLVVCAGETWALGNNEYGQLGVGDTASRRFPVPVPALAGRRVLAGSGGASYTVVLCETSEPGLRQELLAFGCNHYGQLGIGPTREPAVTAPTCITYFLDKTIEAMFCGGSHTFVLCRSTTTSRQDLWCFGKNDHGQLGLGDTKDRFTPQRLTALSGVFFDAVHCGDCHTVVVCRREANSEQEMWAFGENYHGQLGVGDASSKPLPQRVVGFEGRRIVSLHGGGHHLIVLCSVESAQELWAFGRNDHGQLGLGDTQHRRHPVRIPLLSGKWVSSISCGYHHTLLRCSSQLHGLMQRLPPLLRAVPVQISLRRFHAACHMADMEPVYPVPLFVQHFTAFVGAATQCEEPLVLLRAEGGAILAELDRIEADLAAAMALAEEEDSLLHQNECASASTCFDQRVELLIARFLGKAAQPPEKAQEHYAMGIACFIDLQQRAVRWRVEWTSQQRKHEDQLQELRTRRAIAEQSLRRLTEESDRLLARLDELNKQQAEIGTNIAAINQEINAAEVTVRRMRCGHDAITALENATNQFQEQLLELSTQLHQLAVEFDAKQAAGQQWAAETVEEWLQTKISKLQALQRSVGHTPQPEPDFSSSDEATLDFIRRRQAEQEIQTLMTEISTKRTVLHSVPR